MKLRSDFRDALTNMHRLHRESGEARPASSSSSSTSWWQWNEHWWSSKIHQSQFPLSSWNERHQRTGRLVEDAFSPSCSEWKFWQDFLFVVVRSCTADSNLLQPTGVCEQHTLTRHIFSLIHNILVSHWHWLKFGCPRTSSHVSSSCAHVVCCLILCDSPFCFPSSLSSSFSFSWSSSSSMWRTRTLRTSANEDFGILAENDPLTCLPIPASDFSSASLGEFQSPEHSILLQQSSGSPFAVFVTQLHRLCFCMSMVDLPSRCLCPHSRTVGV